MILIDMARALGAAAVAGGLLLTAACGGDSGKGAAAPKASRSPDPRASFQQCLRQHGITPPSRRPDGGRPSGRPSARPSGLLSSMSAGQQKAFQDCASLAPNGGRFGGGADQSALKAFQSCMSQHGVKVTDVRRPGAPRTGDPKVAKAFRTCRPLLPQRPGGTPTPSL